MWFQLLADAAEDTTENPGTPWGTYILLIVLVIALIGMFVWSTYSNKKRQKQMQEQLASIQPGYQIKTIGGICGTVVEVNKEENTIVLETGTADQKSYMKFDMQAIYQSSAPNDGSDVYESAPAETPAEAPAEETDSSAEEEAEDAEESAEE